MPFLRAGQLARSSPTARPDDSLGLVAENLRASHYDTIPVLDRVTLGEDDPAERQARLLGVIEERDLSRAALPALAAQSARFIETVFSGRDAPAPLPDLPLTPAANGHSPILNGHAPTGAFNGHASAPPVAQMTARQVMRADFGIVPSSFSLENALLALERYGTSALPVVDEGGFYRGMISRADIVAALGQQVRPPVVGGMATPLGVWLTTGHLSGGAPPLGLFLSGLAMGTSFVGVWAVMMVGLYFVNRDWMALFYSGRIGLESSSGSLLNLAMTVVQGGLFLLSFRVLPIAGVHAAEHQTVWAIERGLPLVPEVVGRMPRAHPRCGTNLMILAGLTTIIFQHLPQLDGLTILTALVFVFFSWRAFGTAVQQFLTTRPASPRQLESGIAAGREVLRKYQEQPHVVTSFGQKLWNSGIVLAAAGMILAQLVFFSFAHWLAARVLGG